ncbi:MAG: HEPN domain-containing protein [Chitinophagales bacterium]
MRDSFLYVRLESIQKRFQEVELLLNLAAVNEEEDSLYPTLCRSALVLLVAHFEGMIKDITKDVLADLNRNVEFKNLANKIQRTHSEFFMQRNENGSFDERIIKKLIEHFCEVKAQLKVEPFFFDNNKNPAPSILESILKKFGAINFFANLSGSDLDSIFEDSGSNTAKVLEDLKKYFSENVKTFPYSTEISIYNPNLTQTKNTLPRTLWEEFVDNLMRDRHSIVHGSILENPQSHKSITECRVKVEILLYAYAINLCTSVSKPYRDNSGAD